MNGEYRNPAGFSEADMKVLLRVFGKQYDKKSKWWLLVIPILLLLFPTLTFLLLDIRWWALGALVAILIIVFKMNNIREMLLLKEVDQVYRVPCAVAEISTAITFALGVCMIMIDDIESALPVLVPVGALAILSDIVLLCSNWIATRTLCQRLSDELARSWRKMWQKILVCIVVWVGLLALVFAGATLGSNILTTPDKKSESTSEEKKDEPAEEEKDEHTEELKKGLGEALAALAQVLVFMWLLIVGIVAATIIFAIMVERADRKMMNQIYEELYIVDSVSRETAAES